MVDEYVKLPLNFVYSFNAQARDNSCYMSEFWEAHVFYYRYLTKNSQKPVPPGTQQ